jgi:hypothetical protein
VINRERVRVLVTRTGFQRFIIGVIVFNAVTLGLETSPTVIAVVVNGMDRGMADEVMKADEKQAETGAILLAEVRALRAEVAELRDETSARTTTPPTPGSR